MGSTCSGASRPMRRCNSLTNCCGINPFATRWPNRARRRCMPSTRMRSAPAPFCSACALCFPGGLILLRILCLNFTHKTDCPLPAGLAAVGCEVETLTAPGNPDHRSFEATILAAGAQFKPDFILGYGWWPDAVAINRFAKVLEILKAPFLWWAYDDPFFFEEISRPMTRLATHVFTPDAESITRYERMGVPCSLLTFAADPIRHCPTTPKQAFAHDVVLVANN